VSSSCERIDSSLNIDDIDDTAPFFLSSPSVLELCSEANDD